MIIAILFIFAAFAASFLWNVHQARINSRLVVERFRLTALVDRYEPIRHKEAAEALVLLKQAKRASPAHESAQAVTDVINASGEYRAGILVVTDTPEPTDSPEPTPEKPPVTAPGRVKNKKTASKVKKTGGKP